MKLKNMYLLLVKKNVNITLWELSNLGKRKL
jgi:hypothetical protein